MRKTVIALAAIALMAGRAAAAETGYQLYARCTSDNDTDRVGCLAYIRGVWDGLVIADITRKTNFICTDEHDVTAGEMLGIWTSWARSHPKDLKIEAGVAVGAAYVDTYSCGSK